MLSLNCSFSSEIVINQDLVDFFWNVDANGIASGNVTDTPANSAPLPLHATLPQSDTWGETAFGDEPWAGDVGVPTVVWQSPSVHWGLVKVLGKARDQAGNYQAGEANVSEVFVNSTPLPVSNFRQTGSTIVFSDSPQLKTGS